MSHPRYEAKPIRVLRSKATQEMTPKSPCGIAIPPGFVLSDDGYYVREGHYLEDHALVFYRRRAWQLP